ncbi:MAG: MFS transporter [Chlamydiales bacterium]|nr:MFS transporter [Chlamydiales bacterium]
MVPLIKSLIAPLLSLILLILGSGLFNTFVSIHLEMSGFDVGTIGFVTSALYAGILIGSLKSGRWIEKIGHSRGFALFAGISVALILLQALWTNAWYWAALRFIGGICMAGIFVAIESWLLLLAAPNLRGAVLSLYLAVFYTALSAGQLLIYIADPNGLSPYLITAGLTALSIVPISCKAVKCPIFGESPSMKISHFLKLSPLGFLGGIISGMLLAVVYGLLPVYASELGLSVDEIGTLMAILIFGGLSLQWPIGRLADRGNRRFVLNVASFLSALIAVAIALQHPIHPTALSVLVWFFGAFSFTLYPLSMAYVCEKIQNDQIVSATGGFVLSYGIGAICGPLCASFAMQQIGSAGLFYFLSLITFGLGIFGLYSSNKESAPEKIE